MPSRQTRLELEGLVRQAIAEKLQIDPDGIRLDDDVIDDLGFDSLALAEFTMQLELRLGITVPGTEWLDVITLSELLDLIERHQPA